MTTEELPSMSPQSARKAVFEQSVLNRLTLYPSGIGLLGSLAIGLFGLNPITLVAAIGGLGIGAATFGINYFLRHGTLERMHLEEIFSEIENRRIETLEQLRVSLSELQEGDNAVIQEFAEQGNKQFSMVEERFETVKHILERKLRKGELTYLRYLGASETVFIAVLDNLERSVSLMKSNRAIDDDYIASRLSSLEALSSPSDADEREHKTLTERRELSGQQQEVISSLLTENEIAITRMDQLNGSLADLTIIKGRGAQRLEQAIENMEELASRVHHYAEDSSV